MTYKYKVTVTTKEKHTIVVFIECQFEFECRDFILKTMSSYKTLLIEEIQEKEKS